MYDSVHFKLNEEVIIFSFIRNYYIDVKQREDGFNLSGSPLRSRKPLYIPVSKHFIA